MLKAKSAIKVISIDYFYDIISIPAWIQFERFAALKKHCNGSININFRPVHAGLLLTSIGNPIPYSTPTLKRNYFEDQRLFSRIHGLHIKTTHDIIDNILTGLSNFILPQCALTLVNSEYEFPALLHLSRHFWKKVWVENKLLEAEGLEEEIIKSKINIVPTLTSANLLDEKWCTKLNESHQLALKTKCFGIPWTVLHFEDGTNKSFFGADRWPLICTHLKIPCKLFAVTQLPISFEE